MALEDPDDQIDTLRLRRTCGRQHNVGFADAGASAADYLKPATLGLCLVLVDLCKQLIQVRAFLLHQSHPDRLNRQKTTPQALIITPSAAG